VENRKKARACARPPTADLSATRALEPNGLSQRLQMMVMTMMTMMNVMMMMTTMIYNHDDDDDEVMMIMKLPRTRQRKY